MNTFLTFHGGAGEVTGANFLLESEGAKFLIDCGLVQGKEFCNECNYDPFPYDPTTIDILCVTHAHTDHIGRIPRLVQQGFKGEIISTPATKDIAAVMFQDALKIMELEAKKHNRKPLYNESDIARALEMWRVHEYHKNIKVIDEFSVQFLEAGHILGSAMIEFERGGRKLVVSGDLGNAPAPVVRDTEPLTGAHYLIIESVYGDRQHEGVEGRHEELKRVIEETRDREGVLLIPAFSLQRTQTLLLEMNAMVEDKEIEPIDVYLDAPLGIRVLEVYRQYKHLFNDHLQERLERGDDPFDFEKLKLTPQHRDSEKIKSEPNPKIIIAGSGMSHGGRIRAHERAFLGDPSTTILFVGYQAVHSLGRKLLEGVKEVHIDKEKVRVRARVESISGYSAHKDRDQLVDFVENSADTLEKVFVAMGEPRSALFLTQRLRDFLDVDATAPDAGGRFELNL